MTPGSLRSLFDRIHPSQMPRACSSFHATPAHCESLVERTNRNAPCRCVKEQQSVPMRWQMARASWRCADALPRGSPLLLLNMPAHMAAVTINVHARSSLAELVDETDRDSLTRRPELTWQFLELRTLKAMAHLLPRFATVLLLVLSAIRAPAIVVAQNKFPVILVYGWAGWGRDEVAGYKYWGGRQGDFEQMLRDRGYDVYSTEVGSFSSNWDLACDLYAQIKGGQVNYGPRHSKHYGHKQFGRTFDGLFPEWGTDVNGTIQKVHLMGHSMGGQTVRMLTQMLNKGTKGAPVEEDASSHPLFGGGLDWVESVTTISSPNQGTLVADMVYKGGDVLENLVGGAVALLGAAGGGYTDLYDAKLDQWDLEPRQPRESLHAYAKRVVHSGLFKPGFQDISVHSLSTAGAREENAWVETLPNVYYYSFTNSDSFQGMNLLFRKVQYPHLTTMLPILQPVSLLLGSRYGPEHGWSNAWQQNDGLVSLPSQISDGRGQVVEFTGESATGRWHKMPFLDRIDHGAILGIGNKRFDMFSMYEGHIRMLQKLPLPSDIPRPIPRRLRQD